MPHLRQKLNRTLPRIPSTSTNAHQPKMPLTPSDTELVASFTDQEKKFHAWHEETKKSLWEEYWTIAKIRHMAGTSSARHIRFTRASSSTNNPSIYPSMASRDEPPYANGAASKHQSGRQRTHFNVHPCQGASQGRGRSRRISGQVGPCRIALLSVMCPRNPSDQLLCGI